MGDQRVAESDLVPGKYEGGCWLARPGDGRSGLPCGRGARQGLGRAYEGGYRALACYGVVGSAVVCYPLWVKEGKRVKHGRSSYRVLSVRPVDVRT